MLTGHGKHDNCPNCNNDKCAIAKYCDTCSHKPEIRFWAKVDQHGPISTQRPDLGPCWIWNGSKNKKGYGRFAFTQEKFVVSHRYAYELVRGPIPVGFTLDHLCRNRGCPNPWHCEAVTNLENKRRGMPFHPQVLMKECKRGHPLSGDNLYIGTGGRRVCRICKSMHDRNRAA